MMPIGNKEQGELELPPLPLPVCPPSPPPPEVVYTVQLYYDTGRVRGGVWWMMIAPSGPGYAACLAFRGGRGKCAVS